MKIKCPGCEQSLEFDKEFVGEMFECPTCKSYLQITSIYDERPPLPERISWNLTDTASADEPKEPIDSTSFPILNEKEESFLTDDNPVASFSEEDFKVIDESADEKYTLFLDIETSAAPNDRRAEITTICWWMGGRWGSYVAGIDSPDDFIRSWNQSRLLVTFCGRTFDERYITKKFNIKKHPYHIDLHDYQNGKLKDITEKLGFIRPEELSNEDGAAAVHHWSDFTKRGDGEALRMLLYYNAWDVILTYQLYKHIIKQSIENDIIESVPFKKEPLETPVFEIFVDPRYSKIEALSQNEWVIVLC